MEGGRDVVCVKVKKRRKWERKGDDIAEDKWRNCTGNLRGFRQDMGEGSWTGWGY